MSISKRRFITNSTTCVLGGLVGILANSSTTRSDEQFGPQDPILIEEWMDKWMIKNHKDVAGPLHLSKFADRMYFLTRPITWRPNTNQSDLEQVTAPTGFVTDFASVPRLFWSVLPPDGMYTYAAIIHDYLYWFQKTSKSDADNVLKFAMEDFDIDRPVVELIYQAVKIGGGSAWNENKRLRESGERRVLKVFPDSPRTIWRDWKKDVNHFE